jgi:Predicted metal-dependent hydrolase with the TIM-barrel fold
MLIRRARLLDGRLVDVRLDRGRIAVVEPARAEGQSSEGAVLDARGGLLLPGLHDHHLHIAATAAALASVKCGPPHCSTAEELAQALAQAPGEGWLRGIGYHESVAGDLDRAWLDRVVPDRPVRVQHRSGRMWYLNSAALDILLAWHEPPSGLDVAAGNLFDDDDWLRQALVSHLPGLGEVSRRWSAQGVTGLTDMSPRNGRQEAEWLAAEQDRGILDQRLVLGGSSSLRERASGEDLAIGPVKFHLHEADLPDHADFINAIGAAHRQGRGAAVHCVTETELVFTLAAFREAGTVPLDRIEHASMTPPALLAQLVELGLAVVTQPNFVTERGDAYLADIPEEEWSSLYRLRSFLEAGLILAGGSDAPFGSTDLWAAMAAAVSRRTAAGADLGAAEALSPEQALALFLADPLNLSRTRKVEAGAIADLCLLSQDWAALRTDLAAARVVATIIRGRIVFAAGGTGA